MKRTNAQRSLIKRINAGEKVRKIVTKEMYLKESGEVRGRVCSNIARPWFGREALTKSLNR